MALNNTIYYYVTNLQGDIIALTDSEGNIVVEYLYDSWGKLISTTGSLADTVGIKNPYRYRYDTETGLYYLQSRYYNPEMKRFINADVYTDTGNTTLSTNMFAYCENNPVIFSDSTGMAITIVIAGITFTAAEVVAIAAVLVTAVSYIFNIGGFRTNVNKAVSWGIKKLVTKASLFLKTFPALSLWSAKMIARLVDKHKINTATKTLPGIAGKYGNFKCKEAANAMKKELIKRKLKGAIAKLYFPNAYNGYVVSEKDPNTAISHTSTHYGVLFNGRVYCNIYPNGLSKKVWENSFHASSDVGKTVTYYPF